MCIIFVCAMVHSNMSRESGNAMCLPTLPVYEVCLCTNTPFMLSFLMISIRMLAFVTSCEGLFLLDLCMSVYMRRIDIVNKHAVYPILFNDL